MKKSNVFIKAFVACALAVACFALPAVAFADPLLPADSPQLGAAASADGSWQVNKKASAVKLPKAVKKAFNNATKKYVGMTFVPMAYYGKQVVAGTNYVLICKATTVTKKPVTSLKKVTIFVNLKGKAKITKVKNFKLASYTKDKDYTVSKMPGGWSVPKYYTVATDMPKAAVKAFNKSTKKLTGNQLVPMAYLGKQVVAGTNYMFLCHGKTTTKDPVNTIQVVTVNKNLKGKATISSIYSLIAS